MQLASGRWNRGVCTFQAVTVAAVAVTVTVAPTAHATPGPGDGDPFFIKYMTSSAFTPPASEGAVRAIIPLAHQICDARANGQDDLQAARIVMAGKGVDVLQVPSGSVIGDEKTALDIVNAATLAYCPTYNNSNW
jgi:hypothetical protein